MFQSLISRIFRHGKGPPYFLCAHPLYHFCLRRSFTYVAGAAHLQEAPSGCANMRDGLVLYDRDQQRCEQDVGHLPVEEVHSVVGLRHHGGLVSAGDVVLHALVQKGVRRKTHSAWQQEWKRSKLSWDWLNMKRRHSWTVKVSHTLGFSRTVSRNIGIFWVCSLCCGLTSRQTVDKLPVHHKANGDKQVFTLTLPPKDNLESLPMCLDSRGKTGQSEKLTQTQENKHKHTTSCKPEEFRQQPASLSRNVFQLWV